MAVDFQLVTRGRIELPSPIDHGHVAGPFTAIAVQQGPATWSVLCRELDIAAEASTLDEALFNMRTAVREALEVAKAEGVAPGKRVPDSDLAAFIAQHSGTEPVSASMFFVR
jgi:hypothetical protein